MDIQKLLLAAQVNDMAQKFRNTDRRKHLSSISLDESETTEAEQMKLWDDANGIAKYFRVAYRELVSTAKAMDEAQAEIEREAQKKADAERPQVADIRTIIDGPTGKPSE